MKCVHVHIIQVHVYIYIYIYVYVTYVYIYIHICDNIFVSQECVDTPCASMQCFCAHAYICMCIRMYILRSICKYIHIYIYIYIHIYICWRAQLIPMMHCFYFLKGQAFSAQDQPQTQVVAPTQGTTILTASPRACAPRIGSNLPASFSRVTRWQSFSGTYVRTRLLNKYINCLRGFCFNSTVEMNNKKRHFLKTAISICIYISI